MIGANAAIEAYCFIADGYTLKSETIVKSTSMIAMGTETEQRTVLLKSFVNEQ